MSQPPSEPAHGGPPGLRYPGHPAAPGLVEGEPAGVRVEDLPGSAELEDPRFRAPGQETGHGEWAEAEAAQGARR